MCGWGWSLPAQHTVSLGSQHSQLGHVQLSPTSSPKSSTKACSGWCYPQVNFMATRCVETSEGEKSITPAWISLKVDVAAQGVPHMRPLGLFPVGLCCGWGQSTDPSVLFRPVQYYSVWLNDYPLLCHQRIFMTIEGRLSSWIRDNALAFCCQTESSFPWSHQCFFILPRTPQLFWIRKKMMEHRWGKEMASENLDTWGYFYPLGFFLPEFQWVTYWKLLWVWRFFFFLFHTHETVSGCFVCLYL